MSVLVSLAVVGSILLVTILLSIWAGPKPEVMPDSKSGNIT
jgi:hypothetical protein